MEVGKGKPPEHSKFKPGQTGNPNGRPKKLPELDILLADVLGSTDENGDLSEAKEILNALVKQAKKGNVNAATAILNRAYGMPLQRTENTNKNVNMEGETLTPEMIDEFEAFMSAKSKSDNGSSPIPGKQKR